MTNWRLILIIVSILSLCSLAARAEIRDPTRPMGDYAGSSQTEAYELGSILFSKDRQIAVINGKWLHVGDVIDGATVTQIEKNSVDIEGSNGKQTLLLLTQPKK